MGDTNPNGSNQYLLDPRQKTCWDFYTSPKSETFSNATQSAIKAGYTENTAHQITTEKWFNERVRRMNLMGKAEKVLDSTLDYDIKNGGDKIDVGVGRLKIDAAKHVTSLRGKEEDGYNDKVIEGVKIVIQKDE